MAIAAYRRVQPISYTLDGIVRLTEAGSITVTVVVDSVQTDTYGRHYFQGSVSVNGTIVGNGFLTTPSSFTDVYSQTKYSDDLFGVGFYDFRLHESNVSSLTLTLGATLSGTSITSVTGTLDYLAYVASIGAGPSYYNLPYTLVQDTVPPPPPPPPDPTVHNFSGPSSHYSITVQAKSSNLTVVDKFGTDGTVTLSDATTKTLHFTDKTVQSTWFTHAAAVPIAQFDSLVDLYIASFNRAPDALGLDYWASRMYEGMSLVDIAASFFVQPETIAKYPATMSTQTFVNTVYGNVLGRAPDTPGFNYWVHELQTGSIAKNLFLLAIINGAYAPTGSLNDAIYLQNKERIGEQFAIVQGLNNTDVAKNVMVGLNGSLQSYNNAKAIVDSYAAIAATPANSEFVVKLVGVAHTGIVVAGVSDG